MQTWKLTIEYEGTRYAGWQEQQNARTVAGELRKAAEDYLGTAVDLQGAGRTDAGVHALAQVAHLRVRAARKAPPATLVRELNDRLPADIAVLAAEPAPPRFHARHDAVSRTYAYRFLNRKTAFYKRHVWWVKEPLDTAVMARAAALLVGRHDFACFRQKDPARPEEPTRVTVESASIGFDGELLVFRITAGHFLWRMVRRLAGALAKAGAGELTIEQFTALLSGKPNPALPVAEWTAPSSGLFLESVRYRE